MKLWIISDLHLEHGERRWWREIPDHDLVVLAGDISGSISRSVQYAETMFDKPVIYVAGNHEFYGKNIDRELTDAANLGRPNSNVRFLDNSDAVIDGIHFIGSTLWTDFQLFGENFKNQCIKSSRLLTDFRLIHQSENERFTPESSITRHEVAKAFIDEALTRHPALPKVIVTHHAPNAKSIHPRYQSGDLNAAFASDLSSTIERGKPTLWIHGHVHDRCDYKIDRTKVVCNPLGYTFEGLGFDPMFVVDLEESIYSALKSEAPNR
jgi:Icc-related predicted phosphoesterase